MTSSVSRSIVFPGQGVQRPGMGEEFHNRFPVAKHAFEEASDACALDLAKLCFAADDERLNLTEFAQPAILCTEVAMWRVLCDELGLDADECLFAGHSLGEYTALVAANALALGTAAALVRERGRLMQQAAPAGSGAMLAVIAEKLDLSLIQTAIDDLKVDIANDNSAQQVVLSGTPEGLEKAQQWLEDELRCNDAAAWRFVPLNVSAPFHSRFMRDIEPHFAESLEQASQHFTPSRTVRVASNFNGAFHSGEFEMVSSDLVRQISGTVRWRSNMQALVDAGAPILEIGPGKPLRGFFKTLGVDIQSVINVRSMDRLSAQVASAA